MHIMYIYNVAFPNVLKVCSARKRPGRLEISIVLSYSLPFKTRRGEVFSERAWIIIQAFSISCTFCDSPLNSDETNNFT
jgi:hypothetical protein